MNKIDLGFEPVVATSNLSTNTFVSDSSGPSFSLTSFKLPKEHWIFAPREYAPGAENPIELKAPILDHSSRQAVIDAVRYAIRGATMNGKVHNFDPDALVQNAVYALCGPFIELQKTE